MSHSKHGAKSPYPAKHLRDAKRDYWKRTRQVPLEEEPEEMRLRPKKRKPFVVEWRYIGPHSLFGVFKEWEPTGKYKTMKQAKQAVADLQKSRGAWWEYRIRNG